jgi:S1-C subfamily serine protease
MPDSEDWSFPEEMRPKRSDVDFDLDGVLDAMVAVRAEIPDDAFTAGILGTERGGNGVVIGEEGIVLTIGYLITEAQTVWLTTNRGAVVSGYPLAYDQQTGFGLIRALGPLDAPAIARGSAASCGRGDRVFVVGHGGLRHALKARLADKREFAGYWEYLLDEALFATPPHPEWSGAALVDHRGRLAGIGSLYVQEVIDERAIQGNMFVPIDLFPAIEDDLVRLGRAQRPAHPWLGMYAADSEGRLLVKGLVKRGPAFEAGARLGDVVVEVAGARVDGLADFLRRVWALGPAGVSVPVTVERGGAAVRLVVASADREDFLRKPSLQ